MLNAPKFATDAEEAEWLFTHHDEFADALERDKPIAGPSRMTKMRTAKEEAASKLTRSA